jgi:hypothetical protein
VAVSVDVKAGYVLDLRENHDEPLLRPSDPLAIDAEAT